MAINFKLKLALLIVVLAAIAVWGYFFRNSIVNYFSGRQNLSFVSEEPLAGNPVLKGDMEIQQKVAEIIKTGDFDKCQGIEDQTYKIVCVNNIALNLAQEKLDISYCQKLDDKMVSIAGCERQTLLKKSIEKEDIGICTETKDIEIQKECQDNFWPTSALKKNDVSLCDNLAIAQEKNFCHDNYFFNREFVKSEISFDCQKFFDAQTKSDCQIYQEKILNKNLTVCDSFKSKLFFPYCLSKLLQ